MAINVDDLESVFKDFDSKRISADGDDDRALGHSSTTLSTSSSSSTSTKKRKRHRKGSTSRSREPVAAPSDSPYNSLRMPEDMFEFAEKLGQGYEFLLLLLVVVYMRTYAHARSLYTIKCESATTRRFLP